MKFQMLLTAFGLLAGVCALPVQGNTGRNILQTILVVKRKLTLYQVKVRSGDQPDHSIVEKSEIR